MSVAQATLAYGLTIRAVSLYFVAQAWDDLKTVLPFFDLVFLRRRRGTLSTNSKGGAVAILPDEVWEEIRRQLVQEEIADSEDSVLRPHLCTSRRCTVRPSGSKLVTWRSMINGSCDTCKGNYKDFCTDEFSSWSVEFVKNVRGILARFGLASPLSEPIPTRPGYNKFYDSLALIAAPSQLHNARADDKSVTVIASTDRWDEGPGEHTIIDVSVALPRKIDQRFIDFIRLFNLEVINSSVNKLSNKVTQVSQVPQVEGEGKSEEKNSKKVKLSGVQKKVTNKIKPGWKLWMSSWADVD